MKRRTRWHVWANRLGIALAVAVAGEAAARLLMPEPLPWHEPQVRYRADPDLVFAMVPNQISFTADKPVYINHHGMRGQVPRRSPSDDTLRVLVIGDSIAFGFGVRDEEVFAARTRQLLEHEGFAVQVINAGVPSYNMMQAVRLLDRDCEFHQPDWVVAAISWNDFGDKSGVRVSADGRLISEGHSEPAGGGWMSSDRIVALRNTLKRSRLLYGVRRAFLWRGQEDAERRRLVLNGSNLPDIERGWQRFDEATGNLARLAKRCGFRVAFLPLPFRSLLEGQNPASSYPRRVLEIARAHGIATIDVEPEFRRVAADGTPLFIPYDEDHPNAAGHAIAARALARFVADHTDRGSAVPRVASQ